MFYLNIQENLSCLLSIKYSYNKPQTYDYTNVLRPCHNFVFMLEGEGVIKTTDSIINLKAGDILYIPKNTTYLANWSGKPKISFHSLHFSFTAKNDPFLNKNLPIQLIDNLDFNDLYTLLKKVEKYQFCKDENSFLAVSAFYEMCGKILPKVKVLPSKMINERILPAVKYIEKHYKSQITVEYLASLCYISTSRFYSLFKEQTGLSPIVYKNKIALQRASEDLLYDKNESVLNIAKRHGFTNIIYFERQFKNFMGKSPSRYRKENSLL
ncbi:MAG: helix-turn-helix domain-containing protein [Clostridia bacterium]|nr:helix-turn-helix domain-containing protein [Clostridia bacterium]